MTWLYLIVGIACLIFLQMLRGALSLVFPVRIARASTPPDARQFGGLELLDETTTALEYLGFDGPAWICDEEQQTDVEKTNYHAVYRNVEKNTVAWIAPVSDVTQADQLICYYTTALNDGRFAVSQISDPYFSVVDDPQTPAQTIAPTDKANELQQHLEFVATLDSAPISNVPIRDAIMRFAGEHLTALRQRLLDRGKARESDGIARPTFLFATQILLKFMTRPVKRQTDTLLIPSARLAYLARVARIAGERAPAQLTQWLLLILSGVLFVGVGWPLLGLEYTLIIFGVILFHEAGHWAAMMAFGYRNPHITLLPLLGGVTIGHETDPGAVKRAWVALAGPLPGIILGWILLIYGMTNGESAVFAEWLIPAAGIMLFINYLNVLPIPPLDGSHIVSALLPPRWVPVQVVIVFLGVGLGVYAAHMLEFWPLALISASQLFALKNIRVNAKLVRQFADENSSDQQTLSSIDEDSKMEWLLVKLDEMLGAPKKAAKRIQLAQSIQNQLDLRPMGAGHTTLTSAVYLSLVIVPVAFMAFSLFNPFTLELKPEVEAAYDEIEAQEEAYSAEVRAMPLDQLLSQLSETEELSAPATELALADAEQRLGQPIPDHLRKFYTAANGLSEQGIFSVELIRPVDSELFVDGELSYYAYEGQLYFYTDSAEEIYEELLIPVENTELWWQVGYDEEYGTYTFVDPNALAGEVAIYAASDGDNSAYADLATMLQDELILERSTELYTAYDTQRLAQSVARMENLQLDALLDEFPKPGFIQRLFFDAPEPAPPAEETAIAATEQRIGHDLPEDHTLALTLHNGLTQYFLLLPAEDIASATKTDEGALDILVDQLGYEAGNGPTVTVDELEQCWVVAGSNYEHYESAESRLFGHVYWCPDLEPERRYISPMYGGFHPTLTSVVRIAAARASVY